MNIAIVTNHFKDDNFEVTKCVVSILNKHNIVPYIEKEIESNEVQYKIFEDFSFFDEIDYLIAIGGDGTLLGISNKCAEHNIPILAINLGTLGYLANVEKDEIEVGLEKFVNKDFTIDKRTMLEATFNGKDTKVSSTALNDFVITKGLHSKIVCLDVYVNNDRIGLIRGDGLIVSTPTGSTAYNLSAGGPILEPSSNAIAVTPICSQTPFFPIVISDDDEIRLEVTYRSAADVALACDGDIVDYIQNYDQITIRKSKREVRLIKVFEKSHFDIFSKKYYHDYN